jgi:hypothetical protein
VEYTRRENARSAFVIGLRCITPSSNDQAEYRFGESSEALDEISVVHSRRGNAGGVRECGQTRCRSRDVAPGRRELRVHRKPSGPADERQTPHRWQRDSAGAGFGQLSSNGRGLIGSPFRVHRLGKSRADIDSHTSTTTSGAVSVVSVVSSAAVATALLRIWRRCRAASLHTIVDRVLRHHRRKTRQAVRSASVVNSESSESRCGLLIAERRMPAAE